MINKGMVIDVNFHALHRNPKYWKEPDTFNHDRFKDKNLDVTPYLPFGAGPRNCK